MPKYLGYFEDLVKANGGALVTGGRATYADLSLFQIVEGLRYAFPKYMRAFERDIPRLSNCATASPGGRTSRRIFQASGGIPFNEEGIFRRYKALDR